MLRKFLNFILLLTLIQGLAGCALEKLDTLDTLNEKERDYVERFNITARDIRDFPKNGERTQDYFYLFSNQTNINNIRLFMFGEIHTDAANQLWTLGAINQWTGDNDILLFEGNQAGVQVENIAEYTINHLFAAREYARLHSHKPWDPKAISTIQKYYEPLFYQTKDYLSLDIVRLDELKGIFWDLRVKNKLHPSLTKRNTMMVQTIKKALKNNNRVFVIGGAMHFPEYQYAKFFMKLDLTNQANKKNIFSQVGRQKKITASYYDFHENKPTQETYASTRVLFDYLQSSQIPYGVFYPKNLPGIEELAKYFPQN